jgi:disulfide bond formation protein DsbB
MFVFSLFTPARFGLLTGLAALAVLLTVFVSQYGFGMRPCELCLLQRYPYAGLVIMGFGLHYCACKRHSLFVAAVLILLLWLASFALGLFHTGVEQHWWTFKSACSSAIYEAGVSPTDLLARLKAAPVTRCDQSATFLFGGSMALWNAIFSAVMSVYSAVMVAVFYRTLFKPGTAAKI